MPINVLDKNQVDTFKKQAVQSGYTPDEVNSFVAKKYQSAMGNYAQNLKPSADYSSSPISNELASKGFIGKILGTLSAPAEKFGRYMLGSGAGYGLAVKGLFGDKESLNAINSNTIPFLTRNQASNLTSSNDAGIINDATRVGAGAASYAVPMEGGILKSMLGGGASSALNTASEDNTRLSDILFSGAIGAGTGGTLDAVSPLFNKLIGSTGKKIADMGTSLEEKSMVSALGRIPESRGGMQTLRNAKMYGIPTSDAEKALEAALSLRGKAGQRIGATVEDLSNRGVKVNYGDIVDEIRAIVDNPNLTESAKAPYISMLDQINKFGGENAGKVTDVSYETPLKDFFKQKQSVGNEARFAGRDPSAGSKAEAYQSTYLKMRDALDKSAEKAGGASFTNDNMQYKTAQDLIAHLEDKLNRPPSASTIGMGDVVTSLVGMGNPAAGVAAAGGRRLLNSAPVQQSLGRLMQKAGTDAFIMPSMPKAVNRATSMLVGNVDGSTQTQQEPAGMPSMTDGLTTTKQPSNGITENDIVMAMLADPKNANLYQSIYKMTSPNKSMNAKEKTYQDVATGAEEALKLMNSGKVSTGPVTTPWQQFKQNIPGARADEGTQFRSKVSMVNTMLKNAWLGGAITPQEYAGLKEALPQPTDQEDIARSKLESIIAGLRNKSNTNQGSTVDEVVSLMSGMQ